jgi:hypothetical protein
MSRQINEIAKDISAAWPKPNYAAVPYLDAMHSLTTIDSKYGLDDADSIILYFLANAASFRGESARALKAELKALIKKAK